MVSLFKVGKSGPLLTGLEDSVLIRPGAGVCFNATVNSYNHFGRKPLFLWPSYPALKCHDKHN